MEARDPAVVSRLVVLARIGEEDVVILVRGRSPGSVYAARTLRCHTSREQEIAPDRRARPAPVPRGKHSRVPLP